MGLGYMWPFRSNKTILKVLQLYVNPFQGGESPKRLGSCLGAYLTREKFLILNYCISLIFILPLKI